MEERGTHVLKLNIGNPAPFGFRTPDEVIYDMSQQLSDCEGYSPSQGLFSARKAIMQYSQIKKLPNVTINDIYTGNGVSELINLCMSALLDNGDEILIPSPDYPLWTACATLAGGKAVHYICDEQSEWYPDIEDIKSKITDKTKAIIPVHLAGQPCDMDAIHAIAKEHHLIVIEDAAHALGSEYKGRRIGSMSDMTTFSFHPVKPITTGEGGMIVTDSEELYRKLVLFRSHGITRDPDLMTRNEGPWFYQQLDLGYNYRMTDIQCALGCSQMRKLDRFLARRREITKRYDEAFADCANIVTPYQLPETNSGWHLYIIQVKNHDRKTVFEQLRENGIAVNVHYIPVYYHPYYQEHGYKEVHCPVAEEVYSHIISLPVYPGLTDEQQDTVIETVKRLTK